LLTRLLALTVGPLVAALVVLFPVAVPALFGGGYEAAVDFGYVFLPAFGAEMILSGAATALMLSDGSLITPYRTIKLVTIAAAVLYIPALAWSLLAASVLMMAIRVTGAVAMHVTIRRRTGLSASGPWVRRWIVTVAATALSTLAVRELLGAHGLVTLAIASAVAACVALGTIRVVGALEARDIELLSRTMPKAARAIALLGPARGQRSSGTTDR
jgi:hypothetical protein